MFHETLSNFKIREQITIFKGLCESLGVPLNNANAVAQRVTAAEAFCAAQSSFGSGAADLLEKTGQFLLLSECTAKLADQLKGTEHLNRLVQSKYFSNTFVELFTALIVIESGHPASLAEPDVIATVNSKPMVLACKKVEAVGKITRRIREGRDQIKKAGHDGIIVVDISSVVPFQRGSPFATKEDASTAISVSTKQCINGFRHALKDLYRSAHVQSILFCNHQFCAIRDSIDAEQKIIHYTPFRAAGFYFLSHKTRRSPAVSQLEDDIMNLVPNS